MQIDEEGAKMILLAYWVNKDYRHIKINNFVLGWPVFLSLTHMRALVVMTQHCDSWAHIFHLKWLSIHVDQDMSLRYTQTQTQNTFISSKYMLNSNNSTIGGQTPIKAYAAIMGDTLEEKVYNKSVN